MMLCKKCAMENYSNHLLQFKTNLVQNRKRELHRA